MRLVGAWGLVGFRFGSEGGEGFGGGNAREGSGGEDVAFEGKGGGWRRVDYQGGLGDGALVQKENVSDLVDDTNLILSPFCPIFFYTLSEGL